MFDDAIQQYISKNYTEGIHLLSQVRIPDTDNAEANALLGECFSVGRRKLMDRDLAMRHAHNKYDQDGGSVRKRGSISYSGRGRE